MVKRESAFLPQSRDTTNYSMANLVSSGDTIVDPNVDMGDAQPSSQATTADEGYQTGPISKGRTAGSSSK